MERGIGEVVNFILMVVLFGSIVPIIAIFGIYSILYIVVVLYVLSIVITYGQKEYSEAKGVW